ncbi:MAG: hypothetical protein NT036_01420, partial [Candidatus Omnitrophica bacterium]|nr:hypothetical protein [Candidatus Omnitrophota bacterium]
MNNLKKILALIVTILSLAANAFAYSTPYELASNEKSVEKVAAWIINNIRYRAESSDDWQKSEETLRLGTGD